VITKREDENISHATDFNFQCWSAAKSTVSYLHIGSFTDSKYLHDDIALPSIVTNPAVSKLYSTFFYMAFSVLPHIHTFMANSNISVYQKRSLLYQLVSLLPFIGSLFEYFIFNFQATSTYEHMAAQYGLIWSSNMNCQKYTREFIAEALGLDWPNHVPVAGDTIPIIIDLSIFCISTNNSTKNQKKKKKLMIFFYYY
jgi:hypothetical protein